MSGYYYTRHGQQHGPVSEADLQAAIASGQLLPGDHYWRPGMAAWQPIATLASPAPPVVAPPPPPAGGATGPLAAAASMPQPTPPPVQGPSSPASTGSSTAGTVAASTPATDRGTAAPPLLARCLAEVQATASATVAHAGSLVRFGQKRLELHGAQQQSLAALVSLGRRMHQLGLGDADQRSRIHAAQERILSLQAAKASARPAEAELRAEQARLGEAQVESGIAPKGLESEFEAARRAREALAAQQQAAGESAAAVRPAAGNQTLRLAVGYGAVAMVLLMSLLAFGAVGSSFLPGRGKVRPGPIDVVGPTPIDRGDDDGGGGYIPVQPGQPVENPPPYVSPSPQYCYNCNGTGQADCSYCFGTGKKTCFQCNGTGRVINYGNANMPLFCQNCNGTGKQNCGFCQYGKVQCPQCFGRGQR